MSAFSGCEKGQKESLDDFAKEAQRTMDQVKRTLGDLAPDADKIKGMTTDEMDKLFAFEYLVSDLGPHADSDELQRQLSALGRERWECFQIERRPEKTAIYCKRRPETYLRYIPRMF